MAIIHWPKNQRPRERLLKYGPQALSDAELIAIFLRTGVAGKSAIDLGQELLQQFGSLRAIFAAKLSDFKKIKGLGQTKYAQLQAIRELAQRALAEELNDKINLSSSQAVKRYLRSLFHAKAHEVFIVLFLDIKNRLTSIEELFRGTLNHASVYPREVIKAALFHNAASVILAHNHPSGEAQPSAADQLLTQTLKQALDLVDVKVLDHMIIAGREIYSFAEHGQV